ncbi:hypothetical protein AJ79_01986 [Helicocarpus griseus UAMH5409]|uniref:BTB domain-containing protein n=1 Tax=Helicocarpus griseus UAMH5409 TaxID=1447875 RepID=A0A2B7Y3D4_9EURO|nr:hypothetical protein AJ79_01986 [Helicocarpus griseus UAMH5409]
MNSKDFLSYCEQTKFIEGFARLFNSTAHSDVTLYLGQNQVKLHAHYVILSARTHYFDKAKDGGFKESTTDEFHLSEHDSYALYRMMQYIYMGDYSHKKGLVLEEADEQELFMHARVYVLANYFDVDGLKGLCAAKISRCTIFQEDLDSLVESIAEIYSIRNPCFSMRQTISTKVKKDMKKLYEKKSFRKLLRQNAEFASDVIRVLMGKGNFYADPDSDSDIDSDIGSFDAGPIGSSHI